MEPITIGVPVLSLLVVFAVLLCLLYLSQKSKLSLQSHQLDSLNSENQFLKTELNQEKSLLLDQKDLSQQLQIKMADLESELKHTRDRFLQFKEDYEQQEDRFRSLANQILEEKSKRFDKEQRKGMRTILEPLQEKIKSFEERVEKSNTESVKRHESLKEQIKYLSEQSNQVSLEANNLTKALKGDFKKQGNWGEMILENILDKSGLQKGREYHVQVSEKNLNGKRLQPDVVIDLPDGKKIIVDSKVSLRAYDQIFTSGNLESAEVARKAHALAIKLHIDGLSSKNYHDIYEIESPDFVLMFIPIDTAFSAALETDPALYTYAFDKNIVIVTASTLLATLKTVETMWRNDKQNRYALEIATEAGRMYDKFVAFTVDMEKLGMQINTVKNTYNESMKKLNTGTGNLVRRAEKIRELGAKTNKKLKPINA